MLATHAQHNDDPLAPYIGMIIALGAWSMLFATLFFIYFVIRVQASGWYSYDPGDMPFWFALMNTVVITLSSATYIFARTAFKREHHSKVNRWFHCTIGLGVLFLLLQSGLWMMLEKEGFTIRAGHAAALYYVLSGFHAVHILGGLAALGWIFTKVKRSNYELTNGIPVDLVGYFWHFLTIVWVVMYIVIFIVR